MKKATLSFLLGLCLVLTNAAVAEDSALPQINLYTENYGEFNYSLNDRGFEHFRENIGGTSSEIVKQMFDLADIDYRMRLRTWKVSYKRAHERPNSGVYSTARTEFREKQFEWIGPVGRYSWILVKKKGSPIHINSLDDLRRSEIRVGGYEGSAVTVFLQKEGIEVSTLPDDSVTAQRLVEGQIDLWITSDVNGYKIADQAGLTHEIEEAFRIRTVDLYLAMNPGTHPEVLAKLRSAYYTMQAQGALVMR